MVLFEVLSDSGVVLFLICTEAAMTNTYFVVRYVLVEGDVTRCLYEDHMNLWHPAIGSCYTIVNHRAPGVPYRVVDVHSQHEPWEIVNELRLAITVVLEPIESTHPTSEL